MITQPADYIHSLDADPVKRIRHSRQDIACTPHMLYIITVLWTKRLRMPTPLHTVTLDDVLARSDVWRGNRLASAPTPALASGGTSR